MSKAVIISADEIKKSIPDYDPDKAHLVHRESARLADRKFTETVKKSNYERVILMSGGSASGKTEFLSKHLDNEPAIIFDGTLPSLEGAQIKTRLAQKFGKQVSITAVWPKDLRIAFGAFLQRDRKFPDDFFYKTHADSRRALLAIAESNLNVTISFIESAYVEGNLQFSVSKSNNKEELIEFIRAHQYTEEAILKLITNNHKND